MRRLFLLYLAIAVFSLTSCHHHREPDVKVTGQLKQWHTVTLMITGPLVAEFSADNPFLDYRLEATFTNGNKTYVVPGFFAADGNAAESGAVYGNKWEVRFCPDKTGTWNYKVSFVKGRNVAIADNADVKGEAVNPNGFEGSFEIAPSDKKGRDFRAQGRLEYTGGHYLKFAGSGKYFLKAGADSPENFLAYAGFDDTYKPGALQNREGEAASGPKLHEYEPHIKDWHEGDPVWHGDKGKGIIGALNYLASQGMNSVYFLTMNVQGDGDDVWPWSRRNERYRFDCSKLDQWEIVFDHMDSLGIMQHVVTQETENETLLDNGNTDAQRKLYYRELVARFGHHPALVWNLGEENGPADWTPNGQNDAQRKSMASYLAKIDPYHHPIVIHTHSDNANRDKVLIPMLGFKSLDGVSLQMGNPYDVHQVTKKWWQNSDTTQHRWVVTLDEIGPAWKGALPDKNDAQHDTIRHQCLWGSLMAGGAGVEWYFGYKFPNNDLNCENWRSRENLWKQTKIATDFFQQYVPFQNMQPADNLIITNDREQSYCLADPGKTYVIYLAEGTTWSRFKVSKAGEIYNISWFNPRTGGALQKGTMETTTGDGWIDFGRAPSDKDKDWVVLLRRKS
ncbi:DUF5060 domain-containing protein [Prolixibacter bellariivorans]|nr:DUF5060 domain-containing protein [Prolixibacter bellariivorans]